MPPARLGLIVNPIAGMGGAVGLKGTDGALLARARERGAEPRAGPRTTVVLAALAASRGPLELVTAPGALGEAPARAAGLEPEVIAMGVGATTTAEDTRRAAEALVARGIALLLFAGGDGTARDILAAVGRRVPVLGIPCGVKMHSAVFAATPRAAADVVRTFLAARDREGLLVDGEVMDRPWDEAGRPGSPRLFGVLSVPRVGLLVAGAKAGPPADRLLGGACEQLAALARDGRLTLLGPGSTLARVKRLLGFEGTLLGVDAVLAGRLVGRDLGERELLELVKGQRPRIVLGVVGGQGFLFGRGNQQFSPAVLRAVGLDQIEVVAAADKLTALPGGLLVDTGDAALDEALAGYRPVHVGARRRLLMPVRAVGSAPEGPA